VVLPHEHVFIDLMREYRGDGLLHDEALAISEVARFAAAGGTTLVDVTSIGLGRQPVALRRVSLATGVRIVMGTGYYREPYLDRTEIDRLSVDELAAGIVHDLEVGVDGTDVRAGIIGEIACDRWLTAAEERCFRAAARAHLRTGASITTHAARWPVGLAQLDVLAQEGVDPGRVMIGHCDLVPDAGYHLALARRGAWVQFDCIQGRHEYDTEMRIGHIRALVEAGFEDRILLSHDVCLRSDLAAMGGPGYSYVLSGFRQKLLERGFSAQLVQRIVVDNPRRALTGAS
ncbi:MAG: phosphotriesterase family protein, partial [Candidatus Limnocylindrales bacterium]